MNGKGGLPPSFICWVVQFLMRSINPKKRIQSADLHFVIVVVYVSGGERGVFFLRKKWRKSRETKNSEKTIAVSLCC